MTTPDEILAECRDLLSAGKTHEDIIRTLRERGLSKGKSINALVDLGAATQGEAKRLVHFSEVWADFRKSDEKFHQDIEDKMKKSAD